MTLDWKLLWIVLGLVLILEGLPYFLAPERAQAFLRQLEAAEPSALRLMGFVAMMIGLALVVLGRWIW